jgi:glyoxylase-like metal-dependent hydrolase (beta-lactamase superfamily II)
MERRTVGHVDVIALIDNVQVYPASAIYPNAGDRLNAYSAFMDADGGMALNFAAFVVHDGNATILVDTGWGPEFSGKLMEELDAAGLTPGDIDVLTFTHLHGDHTGWNIDRATGKPLFPRARYLVPKRDWDAYTRDGVDSVVRDVMPLEKTGRMELVDGERVLTAGCTLVSTPGHTPGHQCLAIVSAGAHGFILGDVVLTHADAIDPSLESSFDSDHAVAEATRRAAIARLANNRSLVGASHLPVPGFGRFEVADGRSRWIEG